jgi:hypothetical protein
VRRHRAVLLNEDSSLERSPPLGEPPAAAPERGPDTGAGVTAPRASSSEEAPPPFSAPPSEPAAQASEPAPAPPAVAPAPSPTANRPALRPTEPGHDGEDPTRPDRLPEKWLEAYRMRLAGARKVEVEEYLRRTGAEDAPRIAGEVFRDAPEDR